MTSAKSGRGAEPTLKRDVALANLIIERFGLSNAFGHASARIPGTDTFFMPTRRSPGLASASTLLVLDTEGKILSGRGTPNSELWIHARIYAARPDVGGDVRAATVAACMLEESAGIQLRMLAAAGGDAARLRAYTREEAGSVSDQISPRVVERAWEYYALAAEQRPLGG